MSYKNTQKNLLLVLMLFISTIHIAQPTKTIESINIPISYDKPATIFINDSIKYDNTGAEQIKAMINYDSKEGISIIKIQFMCYEGACEKEDFYETTYTIYTKAGYVFSFNIVYGENSNLFFFKKEEYPEYLIASKPKLKVEKKVETEKEDTLKTKSLSINEIKLLSDSLFYQKPNIGDINHANKKVIVGMTHLYVKYDCIFVGIEIINKSNIKYDIDFIKFSEINKKNLYNRNYTEDEKELNILYESNEKLTEVLEKSYIQKTYVFKKFSLSENKLIIIDLWEKDGERNLSMKLSDNKLMKIDVFPSN